MASLYFGDCRKYRISCQFCCKTSRKILEKSRFSKRVFQKQCTTNKKKNLSSGHEGTLKNNGTIISQKKRNFHSFCLRPAQALKSFTRKNCIDILTRFRLQLILFFRKCIHKNLICGAIHYCLITPHGIMCTVYMNFEQKILFKLWPPKIIVKKCKYFKIKNCLHFARSKNQIYVRITA